MTHVIHRYVGKVFWFFMHLSVQMVVGLWMIGLDGLIALMHCTARKASASVEPEREASPCPRHNYQPRRSGCSFARERRDRSQVELAWLRNLVSNHPEPNIKRHAHTITGGG